MAKFRKKPVIIEAFQITAETREDNRDWPCWLHRAWSMGISEVGGVSVANPQDLTDRRLAIATLEGVMICNIGDWIIRGVKGELYACKPSIFAITYEPVTEEQTCPAS